MYHRQALTYLSEWYSRKGRKPLVIRGARQVGKTELVRLFCKNSQIDLVEINLEEIKVSEFEKESSFDLERALAEIMALTNKKIGSQTLLFIDEIQESKKGYDRLRYFKEKKPELAVIAAGSLLEFELNRGKHTAPVGRLEYLFLGPMTFNEFLMAQKKAILCEQIQEIDFEQKNPISESVHQRLIEHLKDYFFVGGMPQAVYEFVEGQLDYAAARRTQESIIESYRQDIRKHTSGKTSQVVLEVFDRMAFHIGNKIKYTNFSNEKSSYVREALNILDDIFVIQKVYHSSCGGIPIKKNQSFDIYKIYILDVGIFNCLMKTNWSDLMSLNESDLLNKGEMAEQFVAQHFYLNTFKTKKENLNFWLRDKNPDNAEVDFVKTIDGKIIPIEVKAGKSGTIKSLIRFMYEKMPITDKAIRYDLKYRETFWQQVSFKLKVKDGIDSVEFFINNRPLYVMD